MSGSDDINGDSSDDDRGVGAGDGFRVAAPV